MKTYKVALIDVGEKLPVDFSLKILSNKLNSLQANFKFDVVSSIPVQTLEEPDFAEQWYYFDKIFRILRGHDDFEKFDYFIGITHVRVTKQEHNSESDGNRDYCRKVSES